MLYASDSFGPEESLLSHELYFGPPGYERPTIVSPQEWFRKSVLLFHCGADSSSADAVPPSPVVEATLMGDFPCLAVRLPMCTVALNFAEAEQSLSLPGGEIKLGPQSAMIIR